MTRYLEDEWFPAIRASVRPTTWEHYNRLFRDYVRPGLGRTLLPNLAPARLNAFYADLLESGRLNGDGSKPGLAPKTVRHVHTMLHKALEDAMRWAISPQPGFARDTAEAADARNEGLDTRAAPDVRRSRSLAPSVRCVAYLVMTGMRRGEVLGLGWDHVDLRRARVSVVRNLTVVRYGRVEFSGPKTAKGRRSIAARPDETIVAIKSHRTRQQEEQLAGGRSAWQNRGLVFCREDGSPIHPQRFTELVRLFSPAMRGCRESGCTTCGTATRQRRRCRGGHTREVVSERLGHASIAITLDTEPLT